VTKRLRVGVVGTGVIAQVMHLHYLEELADSYEVAAVCDIVAENARACAERYRVPAVFTDWRELVRQPLDAVLVLTSGSHAPIAVAAAQAGMHVLVEKPMCFSVPEGQAMVDAARQAGGCRRTIRYHLDDFGAWCALVVGDLNAQRRMRRRSGLDQLVGDPLGLIDRDRKAKSDRTALRIGRVTAQCGDRRVDADQLPAHVDQRAAGVTRVDRGVGLDRIENGVLVTRLAGRGHRAVE